MRLARGRDKSVARSCAKRGEAPRKQRKKRRLSDNENSCTRRRATYLNHVWSYAFVMYLTEYGRRLKMMPIVGEYTRGVPDHRGRALGEHSACIPVPSKGRAAFIRSDNGPEFMANTIKRWQEVSGVRILYIEPGPPWENTYSETFISRFGDVLL